MTDLMGRVRGRQVEIEAAVLTRVSALANPREARDPEYKLGLKSAVQAALDYALGALEEGPGPREPIPAELPAQAQRAAGIGIGLDTVLRRYFAGYTLLSDCLVSEAERGGVADGPPLRELLHRQSELFEHLIAAVSHSYTTEAAERLKTAESRRAERLRRLLDGELVDVSELNYPFEGWHLGILATGPDAPATIRELASVLECSLLLVRPGGEVVWAWLGWRQAPDPERLGEAAERTPGRIATLALGEPAEGLDGWRASHRQAAAALPVAQRSGMSPIRYADVALLAASLRDEVLATTLRVRYLAPLLDERDGEALCGTARAYFAAGRNLSAAAAALRVSRPTVRRRLGVIEERTGRTIEECAAEIETALALHELAHGGRAI